MWTRRRALQCPPSPHLTNSAVFRLLRRASDKDKDWVHFKHPRESQFLHPRESPFPQFRYAPAPSTALGTSRTSGVTLPPPAAGPRPSYTTTGAVTYTGPFANTMRRRDESAMRADRERQDRESERERRERQEAQFARDRREFERSQHERERREEREREDRLRRDRDHCEFEGAQNEPYGYYHHGSTHDRRGQDDRGHLTPRRDVRNSFADTLESGALRDDRRARAHAQDRAKEEKLRELARGSRGSRAPSSTKSADAPPHTVPDVEKAARDSRGPILPTAAYDEDESEYGGTDDSDDEDEALKKYRAREDPHAMAALAPPESIGAGSWSTISLSSAPAMRNMLRWMAAGCPKARATFKYLRDYYAHHPTAWRSDGIQLLLREQARAEKSWVYITTGDATPMSRRPTASGAPPEPTRNDRRKMKRLHEAKTAAKNKGRGPALPPTMLPHVPPDRDAPDRKTPVPDQDVAMPEAPAGIPAPPAPAPAPTLPRPPPAIWEQSYLGFSLTNKLASHMSTLAPTTWMQGVRLEDGSWPNCDTPMGARPLRNDVLAACTINFLAPSRLHTSMHRSRFLAEVLTGFSIAGLFEHFVRVGRYVRGSHRIEDYPWDGQNFTMSLGFAWVVMHGIWAGSPAAQLIHQFAVSWRNAREGNDSPTGEEFQTSPHNAGEIEAWSAAHLTQWEDIWHGPLRLGAVLNVPAPVAVEDTEMKDEEPEFTTNDAAGIPLPESAPTSPMSPVSPPPENQGGEEGEETASVTLGTKPANFTEVSGNELTPNAERPNSLLNIDRFLFAREGLCADKGSVREMLRADTGSVRKGSCADKGDVRGELHADKGRHKGGVHVPPKGPVKDPLKARKGAGNRCQGARAFDARRAHDHERRLCDTKGGRAKSKVVKLALSCHEGAITPRLCLAVAWHHPRLALTKTFWELDGRGCCVTVLNLADRRELKTGAGPGT
ncbi:hypothetical protein DFH06DRAFT_1153209 [Mycena polygramma]|nr:hypothetical protein DFH06DRAFT_1153209 [Mycena polygramma]